jgi:CheY-like chemotaxis protein
VVLVVDDERTVRDSVVRVLARHGYSVYSAADGAEAEEMFQERSDEIEILISDIEMPGMSGRVLADRLRVINPSLKVLFLSGHTRDVLLRKRFLEHQEEFLQKPFPLAALTQKLRELADRE